MAKACDLLVFQSEHERLSLFSSLLSSFPHFFPNYYYSPVPSHFKLPGMTAKHSNRTTSKLYQQDIVKKLGAPDTYGIVLRCWHDADEVPLASPSTDPLMRPLQHGEVGVSFITNGGEREILSESHLRLVDRTLQPGDYCKRSINDVRSGVVTNVKVRGRLAHVISGEVIEGWKSVDDVEDRAYGEIGDYVIYDDWIGQIIEVFDESVIEVSTGQLIRLPELSSRLAVGEKGTDILPPPASGLDAFFDYVLGHVRSDGSNTVVSVRHTVYAIAWLAINQSLSPFEAEKRKRPRRFWSGADISELTLLQGRADLELRIGDRVRLKNPSEQPSTTHGQEGTPPGVVTVQTFLVTETETMLDILWQDGEQETLKSTEVLPYLNPDEYDCWPGDHVVWKSEDSKRSAIVQSVIAADRTALILIPDTGSTELASVLELDPHGTSDPDVLISLPDGLGVRRGDFVFIHREGTSNGHERPKVPRIGELEAWVREGHFSDWRKDMMDMGNDLAARQSSMDDDENLMHLPHKENIHLPWIGEVTGLNLDGTVEITHPDWIVKVYPLERLTRLYDGIEQLEDDMWDDDASNDQGSVAEDDHMWSTPHDVWQHGNGDVNSELADVVVGDETDDDDYDDDMEDAFQCWDDESMIIEESPRSAAASDGPIATTTNARTANGLNEDDCQPSPSSDIAVVNNYITRSDNTFSEEIPWKRFDVLPSAPVDHAFYNSIPSQPSKSFLARLTKEYRVLSGSLPDSIVVRAYEDRTDLLRSLIIGPHNTPYEDAPFVIDWMLDSNFPHSPPTAHFLSWTNGNGRVNPNLYEEGKVCLSILGTWAGDRNETWSASRSSLLQALVSIQGLVLVKEPWFCEPAYDKLRGTEEGIVNSRLYNEKAYVLSRGFVRRALDFPPGGLECEIDLFYHGNGRLQKVVGDARALMDKSRLNQKSTTEEQDLAVPRLTTGGIITLERTLTKLEGILNAKRVHYMI